MGKTEREIVASLPEPPFNLVRLNGKPFSKTTVHTDLEYLLKQWQERAQVNTADKFAEMLAHMNEARVLGYRKGDPTAILAATAQEVKLRGLEPPEKQEVKVTGHVSADVTAKLAPDALAAFAADMAAAGLGRVPADSGQEPVDPQAPALERPAS